LLLVVLSALAGTLLGVIMSSFPYPSDTGTFYVGNFSAPWAVLAFGAGWTQRSRLWAVLGGVAAEVACVVGFYAQSLAVWFEDPRRLLNGDPYPGLLQFTETAVSRWLSYFVGPWLVLAIGAGVVYGLLGRRWGHSRSIVAGVAIALPFLVEPIAWRVRAGFLMDPLVLWLVEVGVGIAITVCVLVVRRPLPGRQPVSPRRV
jgi:hypothetical protein